VVLAHPSWLAHSATVRSIREEQDVIPREAWHSEFGIAGPAATGWFVLVTCCSTPKVSESSIRNPEFASAGPRRRARFRNPVFGIENRRSGICCCDQRSRGFRINHAPAKLPWGAPASAAMAATLIRRGLQGNKFRRSIESHSGEKKGSGTLATGSKRPYERAEMENACRSDLCKGKRPSHVARHRSMALPAYSALFK